MVPPYQRGPDRHLVRSHTPTVSIFLQTRMCRDVPLTGAGTDQYGFHSVTLHVLAPPQQSSATPAVGQAHLGLPDPIPPSTRTSQSKIRNALITSLTACIAPWTPQAEIARSVVSCFWVQTRRPAQRCHCIAVCDKLHKAPSQHDMLRAEGLDSVLDGHCTVIGRPRQLAAHLHSLSAETPVVNTPERVYTQHSRCCPPHQTCPNWPRFLPLLRRHVDDPRSRIEATIHWILHYANSPRRTAASSPDMSHNQGQM